MALTKPKNRVQHIPYVAAQTDLERDICKVWEEEFQYHPISVEADFFYDLGGHSLSAAEWFPIYVKWREGRLYPFWICILHPTIKTISRKI